MELEQHFDESELSTCVRRVLLEYLRDLDGEAPTGIYEMVLNAVERPVLDLVLFQTGGNQSRAAEWLGINRTTLRKKMQQQGIK